MPMREAKSGTRVANRRGDRGTIVSVNRGEALVRWDDGFYSYTLAGNLYPIGKGMRWGPVLACAVLLVTALSILIFGR